MRRRYALRRASQSMVSATSRSATPSTIACCGSISRSRQRRRLRLPPLRPLQRRPRPQLPPRRRLTPRHLPPHRRRPHRDTYCHRYPHRDGDRDSYPDADRDPNSYGDRNPLPAAGNPPNAGIRHDHAGRQNQQTEDADDQEHGEEEGPVTDHSDAKRDAGGVRDQDRNAKKPSSRGKAARYR